MAPAVSALHTILAPTFMHAVPRTLVVLAVTMTFGAPAPVAETILDDLLRGLPNAVTP